MNGNGKYAQVHQKKMMYLTNQSRFFFDTIFINEYFDKVWAQCTKTHVNFFTIGVG